ncbi:MAG: hypothetical protein IKN75_00620 [Prevotella sp.]|nr:hypothetical protein [Prevotella sp.]
MNIRELTAVAMLFAGVAMAFTALLMPPPGSIFGLDYYIKRLTSMRKEL